MKTPLLKLTGMWLLFFGTALTVVAQPTQLYSSHSQSFFRTQTNAVWLVSVKTYSTSEGLQVVLNPDPNFTITRINAPARWNCNIATKTCTRTNEGVSGILEFIQVVGTINANAPTGITNSATLTGGGLGSPISKNDNVSVYNPSKPVQWGANNFGQLTDLPTYPGFTQVSFGFRQCTGLTADGSIVQWGNIVNTVPKPTGTGYLALASGHSHIVALTNDGQIVDWGANNAGQVDNTPTGTGFIAVAAFQAGSMALTNEGRIVTWGYGLDNTDLPTGNGYSAIAAGYAHGLALSTTGTVTQWGGTSLGQRNGLPPGGGYKAIAAPSYNGISQRQDGTLQEWGTTSNNPTNGLPTNSVAAFGATALTSGAWAMYNDGSITIWGDAFGVYQSNKPTTGGYALNSVAFGLNCAGALLPLANPTLNGGNGQSASVNTAFTVPLSMKVLDGIGNPVPSLSITFTAPASGASGTFSNTTTTITVSTDANGIASTPFTANGTEGSYTVTASYPGLNAVSFSLNNTPHICTKIYVNQANVSGTYDGKSWVTAFKNLQDALAYATACDEIWVAKGTYYPTTGTDRNVSFAMKNGVAIYGGFSGNGTETQLSQRNWNTNVTTLSGEIGAAGNSDNSYRVINNNFNTGNRLTDNAILNGFIITGGNANGGFPLNLGGGMWNNYASPTITNCIFSGNNADAGGGMYNANAKPTISNCLFVGNSASAGGSGLANGDDTPSIITNCTFYGNTGSAAILTQSNFSATNCIVWGNYSGISGGRGTVTYSIIQGGFDGRGNLNVDPLFVDAAGGNFRLQSCSFAIDGGTDANSPTTDLDNNARVDAISGDNITDMGLYEYQTVLSGVTLYVNQANNGGTYDGTTWATAFKTLQEALTKAGSCITFNQILVAKGTYYPDEGGSFADNDRTAAFAMRSGLAIYGGFSGNGTETQLSQRNWNINLTTLSGDIDQNDNSLDSTGNSYHVIRNGNTINATARLDGFVITAGRADGEAPASGSENNKDGNGGGVSNDGSNGFCNPVFVNCIFRNNVARWGGAVSNYATDGISNPTFTNCSFFNNKAIFRANQVTPYGGAMSLIGISKATLTNCTLTGNMSDGRGGAIYVGRNGTPELTLNNCIFWNNTARISGNQVQNTSSIIHTRHTLLQGGVAAISIQGIGTNNDLGGNLSADPLFMDAANGNLQLQACSPAINVGDNTLLSEGTVVDLAKNDRIYASGTVDMGAYEYQGNAPVAITPTVTSTNPTTCGGTNGSIILSGFLNNTIYSVTYKKNNTTVTAANFTSNGNGVITLANLGAGNYTDIVTTYGTCVSIAPTTPTVITDPAKPTLAIGTIAAICTGATTFSIPYSNPVESPNQYSITGTGITEVVNANLTNPITVQLSSGASGSSISFTLTVRNSTTGCVSEAIGGSVTVNPVSIGGSIGGAATVCAGTNSTVLSLSGHTGTIQKWQSSLTADFANPTDIVNTTTQLTAINLVQTTYYRVVIKNGVCDAANSASVTVTVNPISVGGTVSGASTVCAGTNSTTLTLSGHTGTIRKWQSSLTADFANPTDIVNTTTQFIATNLSQTTHYRTVVKSGICDAVNSASVTVTVNAISVGGTVSGAATVCAGTNSATLNLSGHTGNIQKWQSSLTADFANPTDIVNTITQLMASNLTQTTYYRVVIKSGVCEAANSAPVTVTVNPISVGGSIGGAATVCAGTNSTTLNLSGHTGTIQKWQFSLTSDFANTTDIVNTTTQFTATNLSQTTYYRTVVKSGICDAVNSASVTVTVNAISVGGTVSGAATVCAGTNSTTLNLSGHTGTIRKWQSSLTADFANPTDIANTTTQFIATNLSQTTYYRAVVKSGACDAANSAPVTVTVNPISVGGSIGGAATVCAGTNSATLNLSGHTGTIQKWQFSLTSDFANTTDIVNTTTQFTATNLSQTTYYRTVVKSGVCDAVNSASVTVTVNPISVGGTVSGTATVCAGTNSTVLTLSGHTGNIVKWQSSLTSDFANPTDIVNTTTQLTASNLSQTTYYRAVVKSGVCDAVNSASATVTVNALPDAAISASIVVCQNTTAPTLTLTGTHGTAPYTFKYRINNGPELTLSTTNGNSTILTASTATAGTFIYTLVRVIDGNSCTKTVTDSDTITVLGPATPTSPAGAVISKGQSVTLTANGCSGQGFTLLWYKSADNSQVIMPVAPTETTTYYARCQQTVGQTSCLSGKTADVTVTVGQRIFVNAANANPTQDGTAWSNAFASLQNALTAARNSGYSPLEIWVAQGTYKPGTLRKDVFEIPSGTQIYGGFVGGETDLSQRNWKTNKTILSGEIGSNALTDNVNHVVILNATNANTRLDGFIIEKGFADFSASNQATELTEPAILSSGGGVLVINKSRGLITNCIITNNRAITGGGILLQDSSKISITKSIVWGNEATFGGGIYVLDGSTPRLENLLIVTNKALGGGVYINRSQPQLEHCTIASNQGTNGTAGGIFSVNSAAVVRNGIVWGNSSPQTTTGIGISYSIVEGGYTGTNILNQNPMFVNAGSSGLAPLGGLGDYRLLSCSPAINSGDNTNAPTEDLEGNIRPYAGVIDQGAYESQSAGSAGPATLNVTENIASGNIQKTAGKITATNQVSGGVIEYRGSESVTLLPGFNASTAVFQAVIGGCQTNGPLSVPSDSQK